jgi:hypothetical protein
MFDCRFSIGNFRAFGNWQLAIANLKLVTRYFRANMSLDLCLVCGEMETWRPVDPVAIK